MHVQFGTGLLALLFTAMFSAVAFYISIVEYPARRFLPPAAQLLQWQKSFSRAFVLLSSLTSVSAIFGFAQWLIVGGENWLLGAIVMVANVPYTLIVVRPLNNYFLSLEKITNEKDFRHRMETWSKLHALRTAFGLAGFFAFGLALIRGGT